MTTIDKRDSKVQKGYKLNRKEKYRWILSKKKRC